LTEDYVVQG